MKTRVFTTFDSEIAVEQKTSFPSGKGYNKWDRHIVFLTKAQAKKVAALLIKLK